MRYIKAKNVSVGQLIRATAKCDENVTTFLIVTEINEWDVTLYDQRSQKYCKTGTSQMLLALNKSGAFCLDPEEPVWQECSLDFEEMTSEENSATS